MLVRRIQACISFKELIELSSRASFETVAPEEALAVIEEFSQHLGQVMTLQVKRFESILLRIWELSREQSKRDFEKRRKWKSVMATCNALYEQIDRASKKDRAVRELAA